jgi:hypothetical protein
MLSSGDTSGVKTDDFSAPPARTASFSATALMVSGMSTISTISCSPKEPHWPTTDPPSFSTAPRTTAVRSCGFLTSAAIASMVYDACTR